MQIESFFIKSTVKLREYRITPENHVLASKNLRVNRIAVVIFVKAYYNDDSAANDE